jgi:hypothetical protein
MPEEKTKAIQKLDDLFSIKALFFIPLSFYCTFSPKKNQGHSQNRESLVI